MNYLAMPHQSAKWLLERKLSLQAVFDALPALSEARDLAKTVLAVGSFRACASQDERLLVAWNSDYLSGRGEEAWGAIRLRGPYGLLQGGFVEVFERQLHIICQRLDGLLLDPRWIHRSHGEGVHSCIAGRGSDARDYWVMYGEQEVVSGAGSYRAVICLGPERRAPAFETAARRDREILPQLARAANAALAQASLRPVSASGLFSGLAEKFLPQAATGESGDSPASALPVLVEGASADSAYTTADWTYDDWTRADSPLTSKQRRILESDIVDRQPLRIVGAAGSGKTLLMMLLAIRMLRRASEHKTRLKAIYVVHNAAMEDKVWNRFFGLSAESYLAGDGEQVLEVRTLLDYTRSVLEVPVDAVFDADALQSKRFQIEIVEETLRHLLTPQRADKEGMPLLGEIAGRSELIPILAALVTNEIGVAIKGHGLADDRKTYVASERRLSRLHGVMNREERELIFDVFLEYNRQVFEDLEIFDTDDLSVSLLGKLMTPLWAMKRRKLGFDYVFVDETQLFNENERRVFPLMTRGTTGHVPVTLALDEAQQTRGVQSAGLGLLGFDQLIHETLDSVHRSTSSILKLAFFVIQRTTDLFGPDFPDFTGTTVPVIPDSHRLAAPPEIVRARPEDTLGKLVVRRVKALRNDNLRHIGVVCHAERHWEDVRSALRESGLPVLVLNQRGERFDPNRPIVVLGKTELVGGQEFDAVLSVGLEQGVVPPKLGGNQALGVALEQQALREIYVAFTRARFRLLVVNSARSAPTTILQEASKRGLIKASQ